MNQRIRKYRNRSIAKISLNCHRIFTNVFFMRPILASSEICNSFEPSSGEVEAEGTTRSIIIYMKSFARPYAQSLSWRFFLFVRSRSRSVRLRNKGVNSIGCLARSNPAYLIKNEFQLKPSFRTVYPDFLDSFDRVPRLSFPLYEKYRNESSFQLRRHFHVSKFSNVQYVHQTRGKMLLNSTYFKRRLAFDNRHIPILCIQQHTYVSCFSLYWNFIRMAWKKYRNLYKRFCQR